MLARNHWPRILAAAALLLCLAGPLPAEDPPTPALPEDSPSRSNGAPPLVALDLDGAIHKLAPGPDFRGAALVFLGPDCPISRSVVPALNALHDTFAKEGIPLLGVLSDPALTREAARGFAKEYAIRFPLLLDHAGLMAERLSPTRVPESFLLDEDARVVYRGRVDDRYVSPGKYRPEPTSRDLERALRALSLSEAQPVAEAPAVGCVFEAWGGKPGRPEAVDFARHVAPILRAHCVECHREGGIAPFSLVSFEEARKKAKSVAEATTSRLMPPWHAGPASVRYQDERRLSSREVDLLARWAKDGAPQGPPAEAPPPLAPAPEWSLGTPDLVVRMPEAFPVKADGPDVYRVFVLPLGTGEERWVSAVEFRPGARSVVHHAIFWLDTSGKGREKDAADPGPGYASFGGPGVLPAGGLGGWAPGASARPLPDGVGRLLPKGADLLLQVHYHPSGKAEKDESVLGIHFAKGPVGRRLVGMPLLTRDIDIPAGEADYRRELTVTLPVNVTAYGIVPHMHLLGKSMRVTATLPSGETRTLVDVPRWDFNWQSQYRFVTPERLPKGTELRLLARYDNSEANEANPSRPPKRVRWGEQTTDEMCFCPLEVTTDHPLDLLVLLRTFRRELAGTAGGR